MGKIGVVIYGCGYMGSAIARALLTKRAFTLAGVIDKDPKLIGRDIGELLKMPEKSGIIIEGDAEKLLSNTKADAVVLATSSSLADVYPQIELILDACKNVVSTCEELAYPWKRNPEIARKIDALARERGVTVVGTGINPGYLMDILPLFLTAPCLSVKSIIVKRVINSSRRRVPFQLKVGTGLSREEFERQIDERIITGHVGLIESIDMIAAGLGLELDERVESKPKAVIAEREISTPISMVKSGHVIGLRSVASGIRGGREIIRLEFGAHADVPEEYDEVKIEGEPPIHQRITGGVHGDIGTVAITINTIPKAVAAPPGLLTMLDLPVPSAIM